MGCQPLAGQAAFRDQRGFQQAEFFVLRAERTALCEE